MDEAVYTQTQQQIVLLAGLVRDLPLQEFLQAIHRSESVAPILHPSLYMRGARKLEIVKQMAQGLRQFQKSLPSVEKCVEADLAQKAVEEVQGISDE